MTPTQVLAQIQDAHLKVEPQLTRPEDIAKLLVQLRAFTTSVEEQAVDMAQLGKPLGGFLPALARWKMQLTYYEEQVAAATPGDREAIEKTVVDPLLRGTCWGPPSCEAPTYPIDTVSRAAEPFILLGMLEAANEADQQNVFLTEMWAQTKETLKEIGEAGGALVKGFLEPIGVSMWAIVGGIVAVSLSVALLVWALKHRPK